MRLIHYLFRDLFIASSVCSLLLLATEDFQPGFVSFWFDVKIVLIIAAAAGLLALFTSKSGQAYDNMVK